MKTSGPPRSPGGRAVEGGAIMRSHSGSEGGPCARPWPNWSVAPHNSGLRIITADAEARQLVLHELRQPVTTLLEPREEARQVAPD